MSRLFMPFFVALAAVCLSLFACAEEAGSQDRVAKPRGSEVADEQVEKPDPAISAHVFRLKKGEAGEKPRSESVGPGPDDARGEASVTIVGRPGGHVKVIEEDGTVEILRVRALPRDPLRGTGGRHAGSGEERGGRESRWSLREQLEEEGERRVGSGETASRPAPPPPRSRRGG